MKLWQHHGKVERIIEQFTVGNDYLLDNKLLPYDVQASKAHATMLQKLGVLTAGEHRKLQKEMGNILRMHQKGKFAIRPEDEDCHTAIEAHLTRKLGDIGRKVHTARSRNDQVAVALRLYMREHLHMIADAVRQMETALKTMAAAHKKVPLPGYTHMQKAMPSSVPQWAAGYAAALRDDGKLLAAVGKVLDQNPLGSGAGYGLPMNVDRELTAKLLGFSAVQETTYVQLSRGKFELTSLQACQQVLLDLNRMASDVLLFSTAEFGLVKLPPSFLTGSSIMPQKKNYDVLELVRGTYGMITGHATAVATITASLPGGYNRDVQLTKEPLMKGVEATLKTVQAMTAVVQHLRFDRERCKAAMTPELFATAKAYALVHQGVPFREAYGRVKNNL